VHVAGLHLQPKTRQFIARVITYVFPPPLPFDPSRTLPIEQVIAGICVLVWVVNINRFNDPALGGWLQGVCSKR
jgi:hypothetical protein